MHIAISQGNVDLLLSMYQQSLTYGSVGVVIRGIINDHLYAIAKNAKVAFTFEELVVKYRNQKVKTLLDEGKIDELIQLIEKDGVYAPLANKIITEGNYKFADPLKFTKLVYVILYDAVHHSYRHDYFSPMKLIEVHNHYLLDEGRGRRPEKDERIIAKYLLELIGKDEKVLEYVETNSRFLNNYLYHRY